MSTVASSDQAVPTGVLAGDAPTPPPSPSPPAPAPPRAGLFSRYLNPAWLAWAIPGPIFHKEMWLLGRRRGTYVIRALYVLGLLALVSFVYVANRDDAYGGPAQQLQQFQGLAPVIAYTIAWFQMIALSLAAIIVASPLICDEKRAGTLGTLLTTPLTAWQIVLGKLSSTLVQLVILAVASTPLLLGIRLFGGITPLFVLGAQALSISSALLAGAFAIFFSVGAKRSSSAAGSALGLFIASQGLIPLLLLWGGSAGLRFNPALYAMLSPPGAMGVLYFELRPDGGGFPVPVTLVWVAATAYNLVLSLLMFIAASLRLRRVLLKEGEAGAAIPSGKKPKKALAKAATPAVPPLSPEIPRTADVASAASPAISSIDAEVSRKRRRFAGVEGSSREVGDAPILWREAQQPTFKSRTQMYFIVGIVVAAAGIVYYNVGWDSLDSAVVHFPAIVIAAFLMLTLGIFGAAPQISGERESRTLDALLTTPLTAREIVREKFIGFMRRQWIIPFILFAHFILMVLLGKVHWLVLLFLPPALLAPLAACAATGVYFSARVSKSVRAAGFNFALWLGSWAAFPLVMAIVSTGGNAAYAVGLFPNPIGMAIVVGTGVTQEWNSTYKLNFDFYGQEEVGPVVFLFLLLAYVLLYALITFIALRGAARRIADQTARVQ